MAERPPTTQVFAKRPRGAVLGLIALTACGTPDPRILDATEEARGMPSTQLGNEMTELDKIEVLIEKVVAASTCSQTTTSRDGEAAADSYSSSATPTGSVARNKWKYLGARPGPLTAPGQTIPIGHGRALSRQSREVGCGAHAEEGVAARVAASRSKRFSFSVIFGDANLC